MLDMLEHEAIEQGEELDIEEDYNKVKNIQSLFKEGKLHEAFTLYMDHVANYMFSEYYISEMKNMAGFLNYPISNIDKLQRY